jgi:Family of unknown function (DUF6289)
MKPNIGDSTMKAFDKPLRNRVVRLAALLIVLGCVAGLISPVEVAYAACRFHPTVRTYYSDATYTTEVGQRGLNCACEDASWGITSDFVKSETLCCPYKTC